MLFSGSADEFTIAQETYDLLIPIFVTALKTYQPTNYPYPPKPTIYEGTYSAVGVPNQPNVTISALNENYLVIDTFGLSFYLSYEEDLMLKVSSYIFKFNYIIIMANLEIFFLYSWSTVKF